MIRRAIAWWRKHRRPALTVGQPLDFVDECETCRKQLTLAECHVLRSDPNDDAALGIVGPGGTYMSATYCAEHFPAG